MLDLEPIRAGIEKHGRALVLSEASSCAIDPACVREELEEEGFRWEEVNGDLYALPPVDPYEELSDRAKACLCGHDFNEFSALNVISFSSARTLAAVAINLVVTGENNLDLSVRKALGDDVVAELKQYLQNRRK